MRRFIALAVLMGTIPGCMTPLTRRLDAATQQLAEMSEQIRQVRAQLSEANQ
jgi:hypothetical protein